MLLHAASRPAADTTADAHHWTLKGDDQLLAQAREQVPTGHVLLHVQVEK